MNDLTKLARDFASSEPAIPERTVAGRRQYRTIWISDVHLGTRGCNADALIDYWRDGAVDGYTVQPPLVPEDLTTFVEHVIPVLQDRGVVGAIQLALRRT